MPPPKKLYLPTVMIVPPHKFTQPQLAAYLVLKEFFTTDYRGIEATLTMAVQEKLMKSTVQLAAIDGTGFESHHISYYYQARAPLFRAGGRTWQYA